jgi:hypothetical protein
VPSSRAYIRVFEERLPRLGRAWRHTVRVCGLAGLELAGWAVAAHAEMQMSRARRSLAIES